MKNIYEVLRQKELDRSRLEKEVEALRVAAPLLVEEAQEAGDDFVDSEPISSGSPATLSIRTEQPVVHDTPRPTRTVGARVKAWP